MCSCKYRQWTWEQRMCFNTLMTLRWHDCESIAGWIMDSSCMFFSMALFTEWVRTFHITLDSVDKLHDLHWAAPPFHVDDKDLFFHLVTLMAGMEPD